MAITWSAVIPNSTFCLRAWTRLTPGLARKASAHGPNNAEPYSDRGDRWICPFTRSWICRSRFRPMCSSMTLVLSRRGKATPHTSSRMRPAQGAEGSSRGRAKAAGTLLTDSTAVPAIRPRRGVREPGLGLNLHGLSLHHCHCRSGGSADASPYTGPNGAARYRTNRGAGARTNRSPGGRPFRLRATLGIDGPRLYVNSSPVDGHRNQGHGKRSTTGDPRSLHLGYSKNRVGIHRDDRHAVHDYGIVETRRVLFI